jgi:hypothetical protein
MVHRQARKYCYLIVKTATPLISFLTTEKNIFTLHELQETKIRSTPQKINT